MFLIELSRSEVDPSSLSNENIFDQNMFKLQWFKEYLFYRLNLNPESKEDLRENISKVSA